MTRRILFLLILIISAVIIISLVRQIADALQAGERLDKEAEEVLKLQQENVLLKKEIEKAGSVEFIERQARDKLNLARPNEVVMIIPQQQIDILLAPSPTATPEAKINWQGWLKLFK